MSPRSEGKILLAVPRGAGAAVVGQLLAALYDPVWTSSIRTAADIGLALAAFALLRFWNWSPFYVVVATAIGGAVLALS